MTMKVHLLLADPSGFVSPTHGLGLVLTTPQLQCLDTIAIQGRGYHGQPIHFRPSSGMGLINEAVTFYPASAGWPAITYWMVLDYNTGAVHPKCIGYGDFSTHPALLRGDRAELMARSLYMDQTSGRVGANVIPLHLNVLPAPRPGLGVGAPHQATVWATPPPPAPQAPTSTTSVWIPLSVRMAGGCECGAEKTWGPGAGGHSDWCPKARR